MVSTAWGRRCVARRRVRVGELLDRYPIAEPFSAVGVGWFGTGDGLRVSIVDVFADGGAAERARETIDAMYRTDEPLAPGIGPLRDLFAVDAVVGDGRTVEVVLDPEPGVASGPVIESPLFGNQRYFLHR